MENSSLILVLALLSVFAQAYSLQCYECQNCDIVTEDQLKTCVEENSNSTDATTTGPVTTVSPTNTEAPVNQTENIDILDFRAAESFTCYKVKAEVNGTEHTVRGCAETTNATVLCESINSLWNTTDCSTCTTDKCNGATLLQFSLIPLLFAFSWSLV